ncbi:MAG TPA: c-type cytochrome [Thermoanaerobaculia bacterium]|nr:c-type cytochrome [Thermoanaerobaculia bacterium]
MKRFGLGFVILLMAATLGAQQQEREQEIKNVQVLKGMNRGQLVRTMQFVSATLGVSCDFCHVIKSPTDRDFASDDKKEKRTAREMMRLVIDTNTKYFEGKAEVSCNTCHRGSTQPLGVPMLPVAEPQPRPAPPTAEQKAAMPTRDEIVWRYAKALGKIDPQALASMELKGTRETSRGSGPIDVIIAPGKLRLSSTTPEGEMVNAVSGTTGWARDQRGLHAMAPNQIDTAMQIVDAYRITLPDEIPADARVGKGKIGDKEVWALTMPFGADGRQRLFFDPQTGLLVRRTRYTQTAIGNIPQQTDFSDYRDAGGINLPYTVRVDTVDPRGGATRRYSEIRTNVKVDEKLFRQPES